MDTQALAAAVGGRHANSYHIDVTAIVGLIAMGTIGILAVNHGPDGMTVAAGVAGGIAGWLAKGSSKTANVTADSATVQPDAPR